MTTPSLEEIADKLSKLLVNTTNQVTKYFDIFFNPTAMDVTLQQYDSDGNLQTYTVPNRAKDKLSIDISGKANVALDNLSVAGEGHFANLSLNNLNTNGQAKLDAKANTDLSNLSATGEAKTVPSFTGMSGKFLTNDGVSTSWGEVEVEFEGMPIGTIYSVICTADHVPEGALPCDGSEYTKSQFNDLWTNYLDADTPLLMTCSYDDWSTSINTYGQCPMFAIDTTNEKFKVPLIKDGSYLTQALSDSELGKSYNESLPNITGTLASSYAPAFSKNSTGVFSTSQSASGTNGPDNGGGGSTVSLYSLPFSASNSSSVYQDNAKVQGDNVRVRYFVQVATGTINESQMDWSAWASGLQDKANTDLSNCTKPYITEAYVNGTSGYNIWSNGYCEQWGVYSGTIGGYGEHTITLTKTYKDTNYNVKVTGSPADFIVGASVSTANTFIHRARYYDDDLGGTTTSATVYWTTRGYLASGQY